MSFKGILIVGAIAIVLTILIFIGSVDWTLYSTCFKYGCFEFFASEFSFFLRVLSSEIALFSFFAALAKLSLSQKSLERTKYFQDYAIFKEILDFERRNDALEGLTINTPMLFRNILDADNSDSHLRKLQHFLSVQNLRPLDPDGSALKEHLKDFSRHAVKIGIRIPDVDQSTFAEIESSCIEFLNRLLSTFSTVSTVSRRTEITLPEPDILPPEAHNG